MIICVAIANATRGLSISSFKFNLVHNVFLIPTSHPFRIRRHACNQVFPKFIGVDQETRKKQKVIESDAQETVAGWEPVKVNAAWFPIRPLADVQSAL